MISIFDVYSLGLLVVSLAIFFVRYLREDPPVTPYLIIAATCGVANFLGEEGGGLGALALLVAASFLFLGCFLYPKIRRMSRGEAANSR